MRFYEDCEEILTPDSGGLEMLFANERKLAVTLPAKDESGNNVNVAHLIDHLCEKHMKDPRKDLFILDGSVYVPPLGVL